MKTLMIDMDNVITDGSFLNYINEYFKTSYKLDDFTNYHYVQEVTCNNIDFWKYVSNKNFYDNAVLIDGCFDVLKRLNDKYEVYIVTSYLWDEEIDLSGGNLNNKYYYLKKMLPFIKPERYMFVTNKKLLNFDIRIDDRLCNLEGANTKLLFTAWHNKKIEDDELKKMNVIRVNSWDDIEKILLK